MFHDIEDFAAMLDSWRLDYSLSTRGAGKSQKISWLVVWFIYPSEKYDFVSWDDEIPNYIIWKVIQISMVPVTTNQILIFHYQRVNHH
jgi:hypothetical protein